MICMRSLKSQLYREKQKNDTCDMIYDESINVALMNACIHDSIMCEDDKCVDTR